MHGVTLLPTLHTAERELLSNVSRCYLSTLTHIHTFCHLTFPSRGCIHTTRPFTTHLQEEVPGGRGTANVVGKCKACGRQYSVSVLNDKLAPYNIAVGALCACVCACKCVCVCMWKTLTMRLRACVTIAQYHSYCPSHDSAVCMHMRACMCVCVYVCACVCVHVHHECRILDRSKQLLPLNAVGWNFTRTHLRADGSVSAFVPHQHVP